MTTWLMFRMLIRVIKKPFKVKRSAKLSISQLNKLNLELKT